MATPVEAPKLGNTVEECLVAKWLKRKGDVVTAGETVAEIETDKATFEVAAPVGGTLLETFFAEGALAPVYTNLFVIGAPGEDVEPFRPAAAGPAAPAPERGAPETPSVPQSAARAGSPAERHAPPASQPVPLTPRARRFAAEHNLHARPPAGSGPGGRVLEEDLRKLYFSPAVESQVAEEGVPLPPPVSGIRGKIARRMRESLAATAQYTLHSSADAAGLLALRKRVKDSAGAGRITIGEMAACCAIQALAEFPDLNAAWIDGRVERRAEIHLGFACDTPRGLLVPVVRNADTLTLAGLSRRMQELAAQAVGGTISVDDLSGATFTVSNLGGLGIESFTPLLNPPQVAILGVDAIEVKPVRREGRIEFIDSIGLSLTCDHQAIDGAPGARFLKAVREKIENVERLCTI